MQHLSEEYLVLFNAISDAEVTLRTLHSALISAQQKAEEIYISSETQTIPTMTPQITPCSIYGKDHKNKE